MYSSSIGQCSSSGHESMHPNHGLPSRPAFSCSPNQGTIPNQSSQWNPAAATAHVVTSALVNPYQSRHYAQAYAPYQPFARSVQSTPQGYSYSSAYVPSSSYVPTEPPPLHGNARAEAHASRKQTNQQPTSWYSPGSCRCTYSGCPFVGSAKALEIHMMDRHLIYPTGWDKQKRKRDWDADPSLKGKPVYIQGTNVQLDTPEEIDKWVEERRKRWPTAARVEEKKRKLGEAIARGQLHPDDPALRGYKRRKVAEPGEMNGWQDAGAGRGREWGRGRGRWADRGRGRGRGRTPGRGGGPPSHLTSIPALVDQSSDTSSNSDSDSDDGPPEAVSSKPPAEQAEDAAVSALPLGPSTTRLSKDEEHDNLPGANPGTYTTASPRESLKPVQKPPSLQPRRPPHNSFAPRASLLRNLLLTEIRMTVSNLSQAIYFLVDNDFLENVELNPGQAQEKLIEVIKDTPADASDGARGTVNTETA